MKTIVKIVPLVVVLAFPLAACVSLEKPLTNAEGKTITCKNKGYGIIGSISASNKNDECVKTMEARGYK